MNKKYHIFVASLLLSIMMCSCDSNEINIVKNFKLDDERNKTLGNIFDQYKYFKKTKWKFIDYVADEKIVRVDAYMDNKMFPADLKNIKVKTFYFSYEFQIVDDTNIKYKSCEIYYGWTDDPPLPEGLIDENEACLGILNQIYNNNPDIINYSFRWIRADAYLDDRYLGRTSQ